MNFCSSLVCIEVVLCLAVVSTALQKLHKCVTENTTELLAGPRSLGHGSAPRLQSGAGAEAILSERRSRPRSAGWPHRPSPAGPRRSPGPGPRALRCSPARRVRGRARSTDAQPAPRPGHVPAAEPRGKQRGLGRRPAHRTSGPATVTKRLLCRRAPRPPPGLGPGRGRAPSC